MISVTVAIVEENRKKRNELERFLQQDKQCLNVLTDKVTNINNQFIDRRLKSRRKMTFIEDSVARIRRLKPRVLLVSTGQVSDPEYILLTVLRHACPNVLVILLIEEEIEENKILDALASGVRGVLHYGADLLSFSKAVRAVEQGEAWVPRKMLGEIMLRILNNYQDHIKRGET